MTDDNPGELGDEDARDAAFNLALEAWRFANTTMRIVGKLHASDQRRHVSQVDWFRGKVHSVLERIGVRLVDLTGQRFESGMAVTPLNLDDFEPDDVLEIEQMIEPVVMGEEGVLQVGTVTLRKVEQG
ncbi:hypothetical protein RM531_15830 [Salinisphaera sp. P385]|uniref:Uncharacterized protein n=1 Tax=Spectribacter acetivorans TaxID=3075603 RepID=A0ABU3BCS6_9GAMM|nr:hypothetical protein [Salinisphaera sp. P385]MDT0619938.1 hypothetical protein [Salinisphaera sp. P385]